MGVGGQRLATAALLPGETRYPLYRRRYGPQGQSGRVRRIASHTGIRSPDRPARSESLYRLSYSAVTACNTLSAVIRAKKNKKGGTGFRKVGVQKILPRPPVSTSPGLIWLLSRTARSGLRGVCSWTLFKALGITQ
jgi:hypothetical protein